MAKSVAASIPADLGDLEAPPPYRGCIDAIENGVVRGWCVRTADPFTPVDLEIYLAGVLVGQTTTGQPRPDIDQALGSPVSAGFAFPLRNGERDHLSAALQTLTDGRGQLTARVRESGATLPYSSDFHFNGREVAAVRDALDRGRAEAFRNRVIVEREALLEAPVARVTPEGDGEAVRIVAFYLPQFHPIPHNDEWWGPGFTEWTNVTTAKPLFDGHDQPRIPADLGYYDLRLDDTHARQIELARQYGVSAFCYYYYWFSGERLLTLPIDRHCEKNYELDFCLCWANENWSRRWDGSEADVLMAQQHSEVDALAFIRAVRPYFDHPRYLKIDGAPFLMVYRADLLEEPDRIVRLWKNAVREAGHPDLHVCMAETFGAFDPHAYGVDSACQFPPHGLNARDRTGEVEGVTPGFTGKIFDYAEVAAREVARAEPNHLRFRAVMPSWDNTSRKGLAGHVFHNATPEVFEAWLSQVVALTRRDHPPHHRLVFINAWNEWAEGAYLEPDRQNGRAYLKSVHNALSARNALLGEALLPDDDGDPAAFKAKALEIITTLANANKQLLLLLRDHLPAPRTASPFILRRNPANGERIERADARFRIERLNGRLGFGSRVTVLRQQHLSLSGWLFLPGTPQTRDLPLFVRLQPVGASALFDYFAAVDHRERRPDVAAAVKVEDEDFWPGFSLRADLRAVAPGSYWVRALLGSSADPRIAFEVCGRVILHIG